MRINWNYESVKKYIEQDNQDKYKLELLDNKYVNNRISISLLDNVGYKYYVNFDYLQKVFKGRSELLKFSKSNIYTIDNIKLWLFYNLNGYKLLSNEFLGVREFLFFECDKGHKFKMRFDAMVCSNQKCPECSPNKQKSHEDFKKEVYSLVKNEYEILDTYIKAYQMINIKHIICGTIFPTTPHNFLRGNRCPKCNNSKGEDSIEEFLSRYNIYNIPQYKFLDCKNINCLPFDSYLPNNNLCIEYQGIQHYEPIDLFGGEKQFILQQKLDGIKRNYCKINNIKLIEIPYWDFDNIELILQKELCLTN